MKILKKLTLSISSDDFNLNDLSIVSSFMGKVPNRIFIHDRFCEDKFSKFLSKRSVKSVIKTSDLLPNFPDYISNDRVLIMISDDHWISYIKADDIVSNVCILYSINCDEILSEIKKCSIDYEVSSINQINLLSVSDGVLSLDPIHIHNISLKEYHSKNTLNEVKTIIKTIENNDNSLSILRGPIGSGKSTICKWIASQLDIITIFIPINLVDLSVNNPEFRNFISKFEKCLIVIDDCEDLYRFHDKNIIISNIIQIIDTYSIINIHFILSFNVNKGHQMDRRVYECHPFGVEVSVDLPDSKLSTEISKRIGMNIEYNSHESLSVISKGERSKVNKKSIGVY